MVLTINIRLIWQIVLRAALREAVPSTRIFFDLDAKIGRRIWKGVRIYYHPESWVWPREKNGDDHYYIFVFEAIFWSINLSENEEA